MRYFLPDDVWKQHRGLGYGVPVSYLVIGFHAGQDFFSSPLGTVPVIAPCDGVLTTYSFSTSAGWWGVFTFLHDGKTYSLKIMHLFKPLTPRAYKEGETLGYCGGTGLAVTRKYGTSYIGPSPAEQASDRAVPHLHAELHKGEYLNDTNLHANLARLRTLDPVATFEAWVKNQPHDTMTFYKIRGQSAIYMKGADNAYYPIILGRHFTTLFGDWSKNTIIESDTLSPISESYFGLFAADGNGEYHVA